MGSLAFLKGKWLGTECTKPTEVRTSLSWLVHWTPGGLACCLAHSANIDLALQRVGKEGQGEIRRPSDLLEDVGLSGA